MILEDFKKSIQNSKIIKRGNYEYLIHPILDGIPEVKPERLNEIISEMIKYIENLLPFDKIVTIEAMGIPLATAISLKMNIPFTIIRKRKYELPGEYAVTQKTGYSKSNLYINGLNKGDSVVIVDDIMSTGNTLKAVIMGLKNIGVDIKGVIVAVEKGNCIKNFFEKSEVSVKSIISIDVQKNLL